jgi:hypothetical protein
MSAPHDDHSVNFREGEAQRQAEIAWLKAQPSVFCPACEAGNVPQLGIHLPESPNDPDQFPCPNAGFRLREEYEAERRESYDALCQRLSDTQGVLREIERSAAAADGVRDLNALRYLVRRDIRNAARRALGLSTDAAD